MSWLNFLKDKATEAVKTTASVLGRTREKPGKVPKAADVFAARLRNIGDLAPRVAQTGTADSVREEGALKSLYAFNGAQVSDVVLGFFLNQGFIGYQICAFLAQHWLIDKACSMPARDAVRKGFEAVSDNGTDLDPVLVATLKRCDKRYLLNKNLQEFIHMGRVFGIRIALFEVESTDPNYYAYPFNPDGVQKGQYKGISQIDPYWCSPELDAAAAADPASRHFYEPTFWNINGRKIHRSHLIIFRNGNVPDLLKPQYRYGGVPVPQRIVERVYCAERTANEAPQLAMTKRQTVFYTDSAKALADEESFLENMRFWTQTRDNFQVQVADKDGEKVEQIDTSLADLDDVIMTNYQLVAAAANMPATKLLGTTPKGFNSTGDYEESNYHEDLESLQANDLAPLIERHWLLCLRSEGVQNAPTLSVNFLPLDTPTAAELATTNKTKADTGAVLIASGAIDSVDERNRLRNDKASGYVGLEKGERNEEELPDNDLETDI